MLQAGEMSFSLFKYLMDVTLFGSIYGEEGIHWLKIDVGSKELLMTVSQRRGPKDRCAAVVVARAAAAGKYER